MSREIKFRAWNLKESKMYHPNAGADLMIYLTGAMCCDVDIKENVGVIHLKREDFILMQYIGLKDCNDKEIYEGDVVKAKLITYAQETIGTVMYDNSFATHGIETKKGIAYITNLYIETIEVIGNIYENPELLEKNNV